jgi:hypothetical protein
MMLGVVLFEVMLNVTGVMQNVVMLNVITLIALMLNDLMLNVPMLNVVMMSVMAPSCNTLLSKQQNNSNF